MSGVVAEVNGGLDAAPESVNKDPYGDGWMIKLTVANPAEFDSLLEERVCFC